jgi:acetyl esterase/lipase
MSWQLRAIEVGARLLRKTTGPEGPERMQKQIDKARAKTPRTAPPGVIARALDVQAGTVDGITVFDARPRNVQARHHVVYLHGGSYTFEISPFHWRFISEIAKSAQAHFTVPIYPLAPEQTADKTVPAMADIVERAIDQFGTDHVTVMGDSAGGGMALAVAQALRDRGKQPARIILISPWLDVTLSEPKAREIEPYDVMLSIDGLRYCGLQYAGVLNPQDPKVSPMFGRMSGLAPVVTFMGTHDIFFADIAPLAAAMKRDGAQLTVREGATLPHVYPILPIPEAKPARAEIVSLIKA